MEEICIAISGRGLLRLGLMGICLSVFLRPAQPHAVSDESSSMSCFPGTLAMRDARMEEKSCLRSWVIRGLHMILLLSYARR